MVPLDAYPNFGGVTIVLFSSKRFCFFPAFLVRRAKNFKDNKMYDVNVISVWYSVVISHPSHHVRQHQVDPADLAMSPFLLH